MIVRILTFFALCLAATLSAQEIPTEWDVTIDVNQLDPKANDNDATTPFKTINAAAQNALGFARAGRNVRVLIHPGVYRESVQLLGDIDVDEGWIKLEGTEPGKVILNGSDVVSGWTVNDDNIFERPWSRGKEDINLYVMGAKKLINPIVFVEGARMVEVDSPEKLQTGHIYFGEDKVYTLPPKGGVITDGKVEISRPFKAGIIAENLNHFYVENLAFERGYSDGIYFDGYKEDDRGGRKSNYQGPVSQVVINNVSVEYTRRTGIVVRLAKQLRVRRVFADRCGLGGISIVKCQEVAVTGTEAGLNCWAALDKKHGIYGEVDFPMAVGFMDCLNVKVWQLRVAENHGSGLGVDQAGGKASFGKVTAVMNAEAGVIINNSSRRLRYLGPEMDANQPSGFGEVTFSEGEIANNQFGLLLGGPINAVFNTVYGNEKVQVVLAQGVNLTRNIIVAEAGQTLVSNSDKTKDFTAKQNLYYSPSGKGFVFGMAESIEKSLTFAQWQEETGQDLNSYFGDPKLLDPENYQFTPTPKSPWFDMKNWPVRELN